MRKALSLCVFFLAFGALAGPPRMATAAGDSSDVYVFKVAVESRLEERIFSLLRDIVPLEQFNVIVNADIETDITKLARQRQQSQIRGPGGQSRLVLPGVPEKKEIGKERKKETVIPDVPPSVIRRLAVTILMDSGVPEDVLELVRDIAIKAIEYNPDRGDVLTIRQLDFTKESYDWSSLMHPPDLYWVLIIVIGSIFLLALTFFILSPVKSLTAVLRNVGWGAEGRSAEQSAGGQAGTEQLAMVSTTQGAEEERAGMEGTAPFSFIREHHIPLMGFLLKNVPPADVAIVASYLSPEMASGLLGQFHDEQQAAIAVHMSDMSEAPSEKVQSLETALRERLDYVVGGDEKLSNILNLSGDDFRNKVFDALERENAEAAVRLRRRVKDFEQVMMELSTHSIQALFRHVDPTTFARLLKSSLEEVRSRVIGALSEGAAERMREEMELSRPFSEKRVQKEKFNIISVVRTMARTGVIEEEV
jgi:hypothetical protein